MFCLHDCWQLFTFNYNIYTLLLFSTIYTQLREGYICAGVTFWSTFQFPASVRVASTLQGDQIHHQVRDISCSRPRQFPTLTNSPKLRGEINIPKKTSRVGFPNRESRPIQTFLVYTVQTSDDVHGCQTPDRINPAKWPFGMTSKITSWQKKDEWVRSPAQDVSTT